MKSIGSMIKLCEGLIGTKDINSWEDTFLRNVLEQYKASNDTTRFSSKQVEIINRIHEKHFC